MVKTGRQEIDYQDASNKTKLTTYTGADGVRIGSGFTGFLRKSAFALRFGDINPLISGNVKAESRVLLERDITARLDAVAPFLAYDNDPYVVLLDGKVKLRGGRLHHHPQLPERPAGRHRRPRASTAGCGAGRSTTPATR